MFQIFICISQLSHQYKYGRYKFMTLSILMASFAMISSSSVLIPSKNTMPECVLEWDVVLSDDQYANFSYFPSHEVLNLERFKRSILGENPIASCGGHIDIDFQTALCIFDSIPRTIVHYVLSASGSSVLVEKLVCDVRRGENYTEQSDSNREEITVMSADLGYSNKISSVQMFLNHFSQLWPSIQQLSILIDVCGEEIEMGMDVSFAVKVADLFEHVTSAGFQLFSSQCRAGAGSISRLLLASGFPSHCQYHIGYTKLHTRVKTANFLQESDLAFADSIEPSGENELSWDAAVMLGHVSSCSQTGSSFLNFTEIQLPRYRWSFPHMHDAHFIPNPHRHCAAKCRMACELSASCRSFNWLDDGIHLLGGCGRCIGCSDSNWNPHRRADGATGVINSNYTWDRWKGGEETFFLQGEPKGGWTLTDLPGLIHSTDMQMLDWSIALPQASTMLPARQPWSGDDARDWGPADEDVGPDWGTLRGPECRGLPLAAVVYLVGSRDEDMQALGLSLACLDRFFLAPQRFCYPVFFFREQWDAATRSHIRRMTGAAAYFYRADMSFPAGFDSAGRRSAQAKRSGWGYQHMSRFWLRAVLEHPAVAGLGWYLRLDTDSRFSSPVLDLFEDARARGVAYGYRVAGKDWVGRNRGLWAWHREYVTRTGRSAVQARAAGGLADLVLAGGTGDGTEAPVFYTNFELVDVARFRAGELWAYVLAADRGLGIYLHNWGDAQVRWLQVSTLLPAAAVHRYCHFGYVHAAAATAAFECWQEAWVGVDCPAASCALHGRHPARLVPPDAARILFGPPARSRAGTIVVDGLCRRPAAGSAGAQVKTEGRGGLVRYRVWWMGAGGGRGGRRETEVARGSAVVECGDAPDDARASPGGVGQLLVEYDGGPGGMESGEGGEGVGDEWDQQAALVVEVAAAWRASEHGRCGADRAVWPGPGAEGAMLVLPVEGEGEEVVGAAGPDRSAQVVVEMPAECGGGAAPSEAGGAGAGDGNAAEDRTCRAAAAVRGWYDMLRWALLSEEYVSRHLRAQQGSTDVRDLPGDVEDVLRDRDVMELPYRARLVAVHWVVLELLGQAGALDGLAELLRRYATLLLPSPPSRTCV